MPLRAVRSAGGGTRGRDMWAHDPAHRRISAEPVGVVDVLVACEPPED